MMPDDDALIFADESSPAEKEALPKFKVLIADDEQAVHLVTKLALGGFSFEGRPLELFSAFGEDDTRRLMKEHPDMALILLDVVMDTITSGFDLVKYIRNDLKNKEVRIIMRTGQAGNAPEDDVIINYDINDFKDKTELTVAKLRTTMISSLRAYSHLKIIEDEQRKLAESKAYLRHTINSLSSLVITMDKDFKVNLWNLEAERWTGLSSDQATGRILWDLSHLFDPFKSIMEDCLRSRRTFEQTSVPFVVEGISFVHLGLYPLELGGHSEILLRMDDATDVKRKEEQLNRSQKINALSSLSAGFSNELSNIMEELNRSISAIEDGKVPEAAAKTPEFWGELDKVRASAKKASDILGRLLALTRKPDMVKRPVSLDGILTKVLGAAQEALPAQVNLRLDNHGNQAWVYGSESELEQVFQNLYSNALHAVTLQRPEGAEKGGTISFNLEKVAFSPEYRNLHPEVDERNYWLIRVVDDGVGMSPEVVSQIFDPYFTTKPKEDGVGLGMSLVYNIIDLHNGFIDVYSDAGNGTVIQVYLPEEKPPTNTQGQIRTTLAGFKGEGTVLVCDDEGIMRQVASNILRRFGFTVLLAGDGISALEIYRKNFADIKLVILDMLMPGLSGLEIFREMKKIDPKVKVLLSSGFGRGDRVDQALDEGVLGFLQKPYGFEKLGNAVFEVLDPDKKST